MNRLFPFQKPTRWWSPKLSPWWVRFWRPMRYRMQRREHRLQEIEVRGLEHVKKPLEQDFRVLITPNHSSHADPYVLNAVADQVGRPFYFMATWQIFQTSGWVRRTVLRQHGCFSVDREGTDLRAFRQAVEILQDEPYPLVIFPEGEVYHINERVTPFREGPLTIAHSAAKKAKRPIVCVPCGIRYHYIEDPTPELNRLMDDLERKFFWRPRPDLTLLERIYRIAEGALALKELEYLGQTASGVLSDRIATLSDTILRRLEERYAAKSGGLNLPGRVKVLRHHAIEQLATLSETDPQRKAYHDDLDDLFLIIQLFSYPGDYISEQPSIERIAETLDKLEEDVLGVPAATVRGLRRATVTFGEPIDVDSKRKRKQFVPATTQLLEQRVQALLTQVSAPVGRDFGKPLPAKVQINQ